VIGSSLESVLFAFENDCTLLLNNPKPPSIYERFEAEELVPHFDNVKTTLQKQDGTKDVGIHKLEVWNHFVFLLSCAGKIPFSSKIQSIRVVEEEKKVRVITKRNKPVDVFCDKVFVLDDKDVGGLPVPNKKKKSVKIVLDWVNVRQGMSHQFDLFETGDDFINQVHFYPTERVDGNQDLKDLVAVSYLDEEQLKDHTYSDLMTLYKVKDLMKQAGIRGPRNGRDTQNPEKYKYYAIKLEMNRREIHNLTMDSYKDTDFICFSKKTDGIIENKYVSKLFGYMAAEW